MSLYHSSFDAAFEIEDTRGAVQRRQEPTTLQPTIDYNEEEEVEEEEEQIIRGLIN